MFWLLMHFNSVLYSGLSQLTLQTGLVNWPQWANQDMTRYKGTPGQLCSDNKVQGTDVNTDFCALYTFTFG